MKKFEVGQTYSTRSACDYDCIYSFTVVKRTEKSVWIDYHGEITRRAVKIGYRGDAEMIEPFGRYSMSPVLYATD